MANLAGQANPNATRLPYTPVTAKSVTPDQITDDSYSAPSAKQTSDASTYTDTGGATSSTDTVTAQGAPGQGTYTPPATTTPATSNPPGNTQGNGITGDMVNAWYQQYWGRPAETWEQQYWVQNGQSAADVEGRLKNAPQATYNRTYTPIQGFDTGKLQDTNYSSGKYTDALRTFSAGLGYGITVGQNDLSRMLNYVQLNGFPNAKVVGSDSIDFGDGNGPIDVVQSNGSTWFANTTGTATPGGTASNAAGASSISDQITALINSLNSSSSGSSSSTSGQPTGGAGSSYDPNGPVPGAPSATDDYSKAMDSALADLIKNGGATDFGKYTEDQLKKMIATGGIDSEAINSRLIGARESEANAFTSQMADARAQLAGSGLIGQPGVPQGSEGLAIRNVNDALAPSYASAVRDINNTALDRANTNIITALGDATGLSESEATTLLGAVGQGTARQKMFADLALGQLQTNEKWNEFLGNYGLDKDKVEGELKQGNTQLVINLINAWISLVGVENQGAI